MQVEVAEYIGMGDFVICASRWVGRGMANGVSIDVRQFDLVEFRQGRCVAATLGFTSKRAAVEATGRES